MNPWMPLFISIILLLAGCCPLLPPAAYGAAQEDCLKRYDLQSDIDADRDVACVQGVKTLREKLGQ